MENFACFIYKSIVFFDDIFKVVIPLSFTIFFFGYKEQKDVAYSLFKIKKRTYLYFILLTGIAICINIFLDPISQKNVNWQNTIIFIVYFLWLLLAIYSYIKILRQINIHITFKNSIAQLNTSFKEIDLLFNNYVNKKVITKKKFGKKVRKEILSICNNTEVLFQILLSKKRYNLTNEFSNSLELLNDTLFENIYLINNSSSDNSTSKFDYIVPFSGNEYRDLFSTILNGIIDLMKVALELKNPKDIELLINSFTKIKPGHFNVIDKDIDYFWRINTKSKTSLENHYKGMFDEYIYSSFRIINQLYTNGESRALNIVEDLIQYDNQTNIYSKDSKLLTLIASLIINSIEDGDMKQLTDIVNKLLDYYKNKKEALTWEQYPNINFRIKAKKVKNKIGLLSTIDPIYKFIFLSIVKSIELGRYNCAGFLIKMSVKNFNLKEYNTTILEIYRNIKNTSPDLELSKSLSSILPLNYTFSSASYEYCFLKTALLIYYQQAYIWTQSMRVINHDDFLDIQRIFAERRYKLNYIKEKIVNLDKEYGLLFLKLENFNKLELIIKNNKI